MAFILPGILLIGFVLIAIWWVLFGAAVRHEWTVQKTRRREAAFEQLLATSGEPLYCVACQEIFAGPLPGDGCPKCHIRALTIPACLSEEAKVRDQAQQFAATRVREKRGTSAEGPSASATTEAVSSDEAHPPLSVQSQSVQPRGNQPS